MSSFINLGLAALRQNLFLVAAIEQTSDEVLLIT